ncbi:hypothetical protein Tco_0685364, partial [Tanacetum coccineum]
MQFCPVCNTSRWKDSDTPGKKVPGEDDDISDDEDPLPHDLADSDVED